MGETRGINDNIIETIYGYPVKDLIMVSRLLSSSNITINDLKDTKKMIAIGIDEGKKIMQQAFDNIMKQLKETK